MAQNLELSCKLVSQALPDHAESYASLRLEYLGQLVAPMDDMWLAFADQATHHLLFVERELVGSCAQDEEGVLNGFFVRQRFQHRAPALLRLVLGQLQATHMMVGSVDPGFLSAALDVASSVDSHTLMYAHETEPLAQRVDSLVIAELDDLGRIVRFQEEAVGAPIEFLRAYGQERIERGELLLVEAAGVLQATGELRVDASHEGYAQLGLIVGSALRAKGLGTRLMCSLVERCRDLGLEPLCSTEVGNLGAQRAIERAGFRSSQRILRIGFAL